MFSGFSGNIFFFANNIITSVQGDIKNGNPMHLGVRTKIYTFLHALLDSQNVSRYSRYTKGTSTRRLWAKHKPGELNTNLQYKQKQHGIQDQIPCVFPVWKNNKNQFPVFPAPWPLWRYMIHNATVLVLNIARVKVRWLHAHSTCFGKPP